MCRSSQALCSLKQEFLRSGCRRFLKYLRLPASNSSVSGKFGFGAGRNKYSRPLGHFPTGICKQRIHRFERRRLPDRISLGIVHTDFTQDFEYLVALDKFGNSAPAHYLCYVNDHFNYGSVDLAILHFRYKTAVYLDIVDREMLQVRDQRAATQTAFCGVA
jgi:hypothetical protein